MANTYDKASLVLIPSGTKEGVVFSQKPTNGDGDFTFSRSTAATRVNADGLIEKERGNLILQSNQFDTTWTTLNISVTSGQSGYDGSSDAWKIEGTGSSVFSYIIQADATSAVKTKSVYAKAGSVNWVAIWSGASNKAYFDLQNGVVGAIGGAYVIDSSITSVGGGWYRCEVAMTQDATSFYIIPANANNSTSLSTGEYVYIQDAQLEEGLVARDYIETTTSAVYGGITDNVPRLDYTDSSCPSLLLEGQRTNVVPNSEYASGYGTNGTGTTTDNANTSPEGLNNAFQLEDTSTGDYYRIEHYHAFSAGDYTFSVFIKKTTGALSHYSGIQLDVTRKYVIVDTTNGTFTEVTGTTNDNVTIEDFSEDWWRISITNNLTAATHRIAIWPAISENGTSINTNATGSNLYYGLQVEEGSYATSYIPTYGTSVTFASDTAINQANSNLPTGYPFSLFAEMDVVDTGSGYAITLLDSSNSVSYYMIEYYSNVWHITARPNTAITRISSTSAPTLGTHKLLGIYTDSTMKLYLDGALIASGNNTETWNTNIDDLLLGQLRTVGDIGTRNPVREALIFNQELTNEEAIALTTL